MAEFIPDEPVSMQSPQNVELQEKAKPEKKSKGNKFTRNTKHPIMVIVYLLSKLYPIAFLIMTAFLKINPGIIYICQAVGLVLDFYISKNFAGRYLAGLRWHTYVVDGKSNYYFESKDMDMSKLEKGIFWTGIWFSPIFYGVFIIVDIFTINLLRIPLDILATMATGSNLAAYLKCSRDAKSRMKQMTEKAGKYMANVALNYQIDQVRQ